MSNAKVCANGTDISDGITPMNADVEKTFFFREMRQLALQFKAGAIGMADYASSKKQLMDALNQSFDDHALYGSKGVVGCDSAAEALDDPEVQPEKILASPEVKRFYAETVLGVSVSVEHRVGPKTSPYAVELCMEATSLVLEANDEVLEEVSRFSRLNIIQGGRLHWLRGVMGLMIVGLVML